MKNPDWSREEIILAMDLYFKLDYGQMHGRNQSIIQLSQELRSLNIHSNIPDIQKFRSVNSVALKLANLKKWDQNFSGKGMKDGGKLEKEIWDLYHTHKDKLSKEAALIRELFLKPETVSTITSKRKINNLPNFLFQYHKNKEMDPLTIKVKMELTIAESGSLKCEVCTFDSLNFYGEIGKNLMEIHYNTEVTNPKFELSKMHEFVVVCSNCHKTLDKNFGLFNAAGLSKLINK